MFSCNSCFEIKNIYLRNEFIFVSIFYFKKIKFTLKNKKRKLSYKKLFISFFLNILKNKYRIKYSINMSKEQS